MGFSSFSTRRLAEWWGFTPLLLLLMIADADADADAGDGDGDGWLLVENNCPREPTVGV